MKKALIIGITGQDGSYLAEFLLAKGYQVHGCIRRSSSFNTQRIDHLYQSPQEDVKRLFLHYGDLSDAGVLHELIWKIQPDEVYNLGAQSHVKVSFDMPEYTGNITGLGTTRLLDAIRRSGLPIKYYQASSSEMFGGAHAPQSELTPFYPKSPYAAAKVYAYWMTVNYREAYGLFASNGILFNHESPRRGETFVTRKITKGIVNTLLGKQKTLYLGNLDALRDWGFAPDYVEAMWLMLQQDKPGDFVIGTGVSHSVRSFVEKAYRYVGVDIVWQGSGLHEKGIAGHVSGSYTGFIIPGDELIAIDERYFRPTEVNHLCADITKATKELAWRPRINLDELVMIMVDYDLKFAGLQPVGQGFVTCNNKNFTYTSHVAV